LKPTSCHTGTGARSGAERATLRGQPTLSAFTFDIRGRQARARAQSDPQSESRVAPPQCLSTKVPPLLVSEAGVTHASMGSSVSPTAQEGPGTSCTSDRLTVAGGEDNRVILNEIWKERGRRSREVDATMDALSTVRKQVEQADTRPAAGIVKLFCERVIGEEVDAICGAPYGGRSEERTNRRNGYGTRVL
jgi:hypothetical protein